MGKFVELESNVTMEAAAKMKEGKEEKKDDRKN